MDDKALAAAAKALGHPARVQIVRLLAGQSECRGADVFGELDLAQSTVSEHLRVLREAGIVNATPDGNRTVYCLVPEAVEALGDALADVARKCPVCKQKA